MPRKIPFVALSALLAFPLVAAAQTNNNQNNTNTQQNQTGTQAQTGSVDQPQLNALGTLSDQMGTGFIGRSEDSTFVGANQNTANATQVSVATQNRQGQGTRVNEGQFQQPGNQQMGAQGSGYSSIRYRPPHKLAFAPPVRAATEIDARLVKLSQRIAARRPSLAGIQFDITGANTVRLSGSVGSADDRQIAQLIAQMEPGVRTVDNRLEVLPATDTVPAAAVPR
jgi:hypothetical protein